MTREQPSELLDEVRKLRETGEALIERVEDVAASIRYMTNNLLDEEYHPEMAAGIRQLARQVGELVSLSPTFSSHEALTPFAKQVDEFSERCCDSVNGQVGAVDHPVKQAGASRSDAEKNASEEEERRLGLHAGEVTGDVEADDSAEAIGVSANGVTMPTAAEPSNTRSEQNGGACQHFLWPDEGLEPHGDELVVVENSDGDVAIYTADGEHLATESDRASAVRSAELRRIGQRHGPVDAKRHEESQTDRTLPNGSKEADSAAEKPAVAESQEFQAEGMDSFASHHRPYTLDDLQSFQERLENQQITADELKTEFRRLLDSRNAIIETLVQGNNAKQLKAKAIRCGSCNAGRQTKAENAAAIFHSMTVWLNLHRSVRFSPFDGETYEDALAKMVDEITEDDLQDFFRQNSDRQAAHEKALENPENLTEFSTFVRELGEGQLTDEQHLRRDRLYADMSRQTRVERKSNSVGQFQSDQLDGLEFSVKEGFHDKRQCKLWIVQLSTRVDRATYGELNAKAHQLGGRYSSFKKNDAGFQFFTEEAAEKFVGLKEGDADRSEELEDRRIRKITGAGQRFSAMADRLTEQAEATLAADDIKLKNTHRRAKQAASARAGAREALATAKTLRSLASQLKEGETPYLDGIRYATQIETLRSILRRARWAHIKHVMDSEYSELSNYQQNVKQDELENRSSDASDIRYAEYPKPYLYRGHLERAFAQLASTKGVKQITAKMQKLVGRCPKGQEHVEFNSDHDIKLLEDFLGRAKASGYNCYWFEHCLEDHKRLRAANIHDGHELRAALAELLPHLTPAEGDDPVTQAIDELRGKELPGFYPTPRPIILQMLDLADIQGDDRVLEPSAGMGDILDAIRQRHPDVDLKAIERNHTLADVLAAKGYSELTTFGDFLEHQCPCDKIVMNPPFDRQGADIDHVRHAYELLSVGGRLVSVMCKGPFFRSDTKSREFREWLNGLDHDVEELPEGAFQGIDAFRQTGVQTCLVTIDKA